MSSDGITVKNVEYLFRIVTRHYNSFDTVIHSEFCGFELCSHTARALVRAASTGGDDHFIGDIGEGMYESCIGVFSRIVIIISVNIGENYKSVGFDESGNNSRKIVVIAENKFFDRNRVVLI